MDRELARNRGPIRFNSDNKVRSPQKKKNDGQRNYIAGNDLEEIKEEVENINEADLPEVPGYFRQFDPDELDSEDELVSGENNFIEIKLLNQQAI